MQTHVGTIFRSWAAFGRFLNASCICLRVFAMFGDVGPILVGLGRVWGGVWEGVGMDF